MMNEVYTKLMLQQDMAKDADAAFYEKLNKAQPKKRMSVWKAAVVAACVCLLIPVSVWAAEYIFDMATANQYEPAYFDNRPGIGLDIQYEDIKDHPLKAFPQHLQELKAVTVVRHASWEEAEAYLGLDLLSNDQYANTGTPKYAPEPTGFCEGIYRAIYGQFSSASVHTSYQRDNIGFTVEAMVTAENPKVDKNVDYHGSRIAIDSNLDPKFHTEQYTTKEGIPVLIVTITGKPIRELEDVVSEEFYECNAYFAVNNISYTVQVNNWSFGTPDLDTFVSEREKVTVAMKEFLDGFTVE